MIGCRLLQLEESRELRRINWRSSPFPDQIESQFAERFPPTLNSQSWQFVLKVRNVVLLLYLYLYLYSAHTYTHTYSSLSSSSSSNTNPFQPSLPKPHQTKTMPPKRAPQISSNATSVPPLPSTAKQPPKSSSRSSSTGHQTAQEILSGLWGQYLKATPQRVKLVDAFLAFLVLVGGLQFGYCVLGGNYVSFF